MALKVGDLYVLLSAQTQGFGQGLQNAAQQLEAFTRHAKRAFREIGRAGRDMSIAIGAAVAIAAESNAGVAAELQHQKTIFATFANEIATAMLPVLHEMGQHLRDLLGWWQHLNPETKSSISHWIGIATAVGLAAGVFAKILGVVEGIVPLFAALGAVIGSPMFLPILAGLATAIVLVTLLHKAWRENWLGMQEIARSVIGFIADYWKGYYDFVAGIWKTLVDSIASKLKILIDLFAVAQNMAGNNMAFVQAGQFKAGVDAAAGAAKSPAAIGKLALEAVKAGANVIKDEWLDMTKGLRKKIEEILGKHFDATLIGQRRELYEGPVVAGGLSRSAIASGLGAPDSNLATVSLEAAHSLGYLSERALAAANGTLGRGPNVVGGPGARGNITRTYDDILKAIDTSMSNAWANADWGGVLDAFKDRMGAMLTNVTDIVGAMKIAGEAMTSKLGKLGETINAGVQGFQQGGIWGAIIAVIMEFVTSAKGFTRIMNIGNGQFQIALNEMAKGLGGLFNGLAPLMGAVESIATAIHQVLNPVFSLLGVILKGIAPILEVVGLLLQIVAGTLGPLIDIIGGILDPLFKLMAVTLNPLVLVFMALKVAVDYVALGLHMFVDWIDQIVGGNDKGGIADAQNQLDTDTQKLKDFVDAWSKDPFGAINSLEMSSADAADSLGKLGQTANDVSQQLMNVPQGFKVALAEFTATTSSTDVNARMQFLMTGSPVQPGRYPRKK